jgi:tetratricopeptide (TPR) repeat protein
VSLSESTVDYRRSWTAMQNLIREGRSWSGRERNCAFLNVGTDRFADGSAISGFDFQDDGRALAVSDWDLDGDLDLWISNRTGPRLRFLKNEIGSTSDFVAVRLEGRSGNRDAIGARVELLGSRGLRTLRAGEGFVAQSSKWVHFGLGDASESIGIRVRWPGGQSEDFRGLAPNRFYRLVEGEGAEWWRPPAAAAELAASRLEAPPTGDVGRAVLAARPPLPTMDSWHGLAIVPLCVDDDEALAKARTALRRLDLEDDARVARPVNLEVLETIQRTLVSRRRPLALPTSFLLDAEGRLAVIYRGGVSASTLLTDLSLLPLRGHELRDRATPFPGTWYSAPKSPPVEALARSALIFGRPEIATAFLRDELRGDPANASVHMMLGAIYSSVGDDETAISHFQESARLDGESVKVRLNLAEALRRAGRFEESIEIYREVMRLDPSYPEARRGELLALVRLERWQDAARSLEHALATSPDDGELMNLHARFLAACPVPELRDGARALELTEASLSRGRSFEKAQTLAMVCAELDRFEEAVQVQETALSLARRSESGATIRKLEEDLARYRSGQPCRVPWPDDQLQPPSLTLESATLVE